MRWTASQLVHAARWDNLAVVRQRLAWAAPTAQMVHAEDTVVLAVDATGDDARLKPSGRQHPSWPCIAPFLNDACPRRRNLKTNCPHPIQWTPRYLAWGSARGSNGSRGRHRRVGRERRGSQYTAQSYGKTASALAVHSTPWVSFALNVGREISIHRTFTLLQLFRQACVPAQRARPA